jgi:hypothetical protein
MELALTVGKDEVRVVALQGIYRTGFDVFVAPLDDVRKCTIGGGRVDIEEEIVRFGRDRTQFNDLHVFLQRVIAAGEQSKTFLGKLSGDTLRPKAKLSIRLPSHFSLCALSARFVQISTPSCRNMSFAVAEI